MILTILNNHLYIYSANQAGKLQTSLFFIPFPTTLFIHDCNISIRIVALCFSIVLAYYFDLSKIKIKKNVLMLIKAEKGTYEKWSLYLLIILINNNNIKIMMNLMELPAGF